MRYMIYIKPPEKLVSELNAIRLLFPNIIENSSFFTATCYVMKTAFYYEHEQFIIDDLEFEAKKQKPFTITGPLKPDIDQQDFYLTFSFNSPELSNFHKNIITNLKEYIQWTNVPPLYVYHRAFSQRQRQLFNTYGSPFCLEEYHPHITVGKIMGNKEELKLEDIVLTSFWQVKEFYLSKKQNKIWQTIQKFELAGE